jgi:hypothetical protein
MRMDKPGYLRALGADSSLTPREVSFEQKIWPFTI